MNELEKRIKKLEILVAVLCRRNEVITIPCDHVHCKLSGGFWQDGTECGYCQGATFKVVPNGAEEQEKLQQRLADQRAPKPQCKRCLSNLLPDGTCPLGAHQCEPY